MLLGIIKLLFSDEHLKIIGIDIESIEKKTIFF